MLSLEATHKVKLGLHVCQCRLVLFIGLLLSGHEDVTSPISGIEPPMTSAILFPLVGVHHKLLRGEDTFAF